MDDQQADRDLRHLPDHLAEVIREILHSGGLLTPLQIAKLTGDSQRYWQERAGKLHASGAHRRGGNGSWRIPATAVAAAIEDDYLKTRTNLTPPTQATARAPKRSSPASHTT